MKFIYVMDADSKNKLLDLGYVLLKHNTKQGVWVFQNRQPDDLTFALGIPCVFSDTLTF